MMGYLTRPGFNGGGSVKKKPVLPKRKPPEEVKKRKKINYEKIKQYLGEESRELIEKELGFAIGGSVETPKRGLVDEPGSYSQESPTVQARKEFKGKKFISVPDPTYSDGRRRVMTPEYKKYVEELRAKPSPAEQRTISAYNAAKEKLGRFPSIEEVRAAAPGKSKPALSVVREALEKNNLELSEPRGGLKKGILQAHKDLTEELGRPPRVAEIDEQTKNLSKMKSADGRKSQITQYLNEAKLKYTPALFKTDPKVRAEVRAKAAATLRAKDKPRLGQPRKTPEDILQRERYKRMEDIKRDPKRIKRALSKELTGTPLDVHHPFPKREKETLRTLMLLDEDVNRKGIVRSIEEQRNKLIREQNILVNRPAKNRRRLEQINAQMKRFRAELRKTPYGGFLGFPVSNERGKISYIGFDKAKSLAGLREGDKMLDKDFAKASKNQVTKILNTANSSLVNAVNKLPPIIQGQICNSLQAGGLSKTCARAIKENPSKTAEIVEQKTLNLKPSKAATNALKAARFVKNIAGPLAIAGEVGIEGLMIGDKYLETGMPLKQVFGESILNLALGPKLRVDVEAERAKEFAKGEDFAMAERGRRKAPFLAQGEYADRLRREARIAEMQQKFPGVSEDALKQELLKQNPNIDLSLFPVSDFKQAVDNQIKTEYFADNFRQEKAGGGVMKMAGKPSGPAPKSGPTPDGPSKGLAYLFKNGMEEEE